MRLVHRALPLLAVGLLASCTQTVTTRTPVVGGTAVVTGGIARCQGIILANSPERVAGTVTVLRGVVTWRPSGPGSSVAVFPTAVAGHADVGANQGYRFVLPPGHYVLIATYAGATPTNVHPFTQVSVKAGSTVEAGIPNRCI